MASLMYTLSFVVDSLGSRRTSFDTPKLYGCGHRGLRAKVLTVAAT